MIDDLVKTVLDRGTDVEAVLDKLAAENPQELNWRVSIVDTLKLLGMDSSGVARERLAEDLGYTGGVNDSYERNIWLHAQVMEALRQNGGKLPRSGAWMGWRRDTPDPRDRMFAARSPRQALPAAASLKPDKLPAVGNQQILSSCTGWSASHACRYLLNIKGETPFTPSALFTYYNGRLIEGTIREDPGCEIRDVIRGIRRFGVCGAAHYPNDNARFTHQPSRDAYKFASTNVVSSYERVDNTNLNLLKAAIVEGHPIIGGFSMYASHDEPAVEKSGLINLPRGRNDEMVGGHAVWFWAYDELGFRFRNSWGVEWGHKGDGWLPYDFIVDANLCSDFWAIKAIT